MYVKSSESSLFAKELIFSRPCARGLDYNERDIEIFLTQLGPTQILYLRL